jgi:8-oxo-dGTP diphosphatase
MEEYAVILETLVSIFTVDKGSLKVLLMKKKTNPYHGYWILPSNIMTNKETLEDNIYSTINGRLGYPEMYLEQGHIFSNLDRDPDERIVGVSYLALIDSKTLEIKKEDRPDLELQWFNIDDIPKMGYDHEIIVKDSIKLLSKKLLNSKVLKNLFPSDFTLPEIQKVYEQILGRELDRRNFRKKFINLGLVTDTGDKNIGGNGRPGKLYRFNEDLRERDLF